MCATGSQSSLGSCSVQFGVKFAQFYLCEPVHPPERSAVDLTGGLLRVTSGMIQCIVGAQVESVALTVTTHLSEPVACLDDYQDVVELSYSSSQGKLNVITWGEGCVEEVRLPGNPGPLRIRYHLRNMDLSGRLPELMGQPHVGECLLQIWPAPMDDDDDLKITSMTARFWHPLQSGRVSFREAGLLSPSVTPEALAALKQCGLL